MNVKKQSLISILCGCISILLGIIPIYPYFAIIVAIAGFAIIFPLKKKECDNDPGIQQRIKAAHILCVIGIIVSIIGIGIDLFFQFFKPVLF